MSLCRNYWWEAVLDLRCMTSYCLYVLGQLPCKRWRPDMLDVIDSSKNLSAISCQLFIPRHLQINPLIFFSCIFFWALKPNYLVSSCLYPSFHHLWSYVWYLPLVFWGFFSSLKASLLMETKLIIQFWLWVAAVTWLTFDSALLWY